MDKHTPSQASRFLTILVAALAFALFAAAPASAHHGPDSMYPTANYRPTCVDGNLGNPYCRTDNSTLTVFREASVTGTARTNIANVLDGQYQPTDLTVQFPSSASYTGSAETDIIYQVGAGLPDGVDGIVWCNDAVTSTQCDQHYARFRANAVINNGLACHETGHAVGLTHPRDAAPRSATNADAAYGCMVTPVAAAATLGAHNVNQINGSY